MQNKNFLVEYNSIGQLNFRSGDMKTAEVLVEHGADINVLNRYNESPLFLAAENTKDSTDLVVYLVEK